MASDTATTTMDDLMRLDDKIEMLSRDEVKELIVKDCVWRVYKKELRSKYGPDAFNCDDYDRAMTAFTKYNLDGFFHWVGQRSGLGGPAVAMMRDQGPAGLDDVFQELTVDGVDIDDARRKLASICRGSMGMPRDKIVRDNVDRFADGE